eukprot:6225-Heterococcus_DN1.PRE.1
MQPFAKKVVDQLVNATLFSNTEVNEGLMGYSQFSWNASEAILGTGSCNVTFTKASTCVANSGKNNKFVALPASCKHTWSQCFNLGADPATGANRFIPGWAGTAGQVYPFVPATDYLSYVNGVGSFNNYTQFTQFVDAQPYAGSAASGAPQTYTSIGKQQQHSNTYITSH